jgi:hypothetical protein
MQFKAAFEDIRAKRRLQEIGLQFQAAQKRMTLAAAIEQRREEDKAQAQSLGVMAALRGDELDSQNPHTAMAFAETRRQIQAREQAGIERRKTLGETFERELAVKGFEEIPAPPTVDVEFRRRGEVVERRPGRPQVQGDVVKIGKKTYRRPAASLSKLMGQVSQSAREFILAEGEPGTVGEFRERLKGYQEQRWQEREAKTRAEAMNDADEAFRTIFADVKEAPMTGSGAQEGYDTIKDWLTGLGFSEDEIDSVAKITGLGSLRRNRTVIQWTKLRNMLFEKRLARIQPPGRPGERAPERAAEQPVESKSQKFRTLAEDILR